MLLETAIPTLKTVYVYVQEISKIRQESRIPEQVLMNQK